MQLRANRVGVGVARRVSAIDARLNEYGVRLSSQDLVFGSLNNRSPWVAEGRHSASKVVDSIDNTFRWLFDMLYWIALSRLKVFFGEEGLRGLWLRVTAVLDRADLVDRVLNDYLIAVHTHSGNLAAYHLLRLSALHFNRFIAWLTV